MPLTNFKEMNISNKIRAIIALTVISIFIVIYFVILPFVDGIKRLKTDLISQKIELEEKLNQDKNMVELNANLKKIEPQLQEIEKIFINKNRELEFITMLESIEKKNLISQKLTIGAADAGSNTIIQTIPITIEINGQYKNILNYLSDLEALPYYINISHIELNTGESQYNTQITNSTGPNAVRLSISASTYWK